MVGASALGEAFVEHIVISCTAQLRQSRDVHMSYVVKNSIVHAMWGIAEEVRYTQANPLFDDEGLESWLVNLIDRIHEYQLQNEGLRGFIQIDFVLQNTVNAATACAVQAAFEAMLGTLEITCTTQNVALSAEHASLDGNIASIAFSVIANRTQSVSLLMPPPG